MLSLCPMNLSIGRSICSSIRLSIDLSISISLALCLSSIRLTAYPSIYPSAGLSFCLSIFLPGLGVACDPRGAWPTRLPICLCSGRLWGTPDCGISLALSGLHAARSRSRNLLHARRRTGHLGELCCDTMRPGYRTGRTPLY